MHGKGQAMGAAAALCSGPVLMASHKLAPDTLRSTLRSVMMYSARRLQPLDSISRAQHSTVPRIPNAALLEHLHRQQPEIH